MKEFAGRSNHDSSVVLNLHFFSDPPKIIIPSNNTSEVEYQFDVKCEADGNPMPTYVWRNATGGVIAEKSSFKATEDGNYTCFATNSIKTVNRSISITVKCKFDNQMHCYVTETTMVLLIYSQRSKGLFS